jgi:hypothetical protein
LDSRTDIHLRIRDLSGPRGATVIKTNHYYEAFLDYYKKAERQQRLCNLGTTAYKDSGVNDALMENVELYDVVERKYAGFSQLINDCVYGWTGNHPYWKKMEAGICTMHRQTIATEWTKKAWDLECWLYLMLFHRITGSGINYAKKPSGYNNTLLPNFVTCDSIEDMIEVMLEYKKPFYTSVGYQFPQFPKPQKYFKDTTSPPVPYKRGGDMYLAEYAPSLIRALIKYMKNAKRPLEFREIGSFMLKWNTEHCLKQYHFQYSAFVADIADWFPQFVVKESMFYYGSNAEQCISYLAEKPRGMGKIEFLDAVMAKAMKDTGGVPYNLEDVCCDFIRWVENYVKPGHDYDHLDRDTLWSSCPIKDHPFGRQRAMLELGMVKTFNDYKDHPTGDRVIQQAGLTIEEYKRKVKEHSLL